MCVSICLLFNMCLCVLTTMICPACGSVDDSFESVSEIGVEDCVDDRVDAAVEVTERGVWVDLGCI